MRFTYSSNKEEAEQRETELPTHEMKVHTDGSIRHKSRREQIAVKLALENLVQVAEDEHESLTTTTHLLTDSMSVMQALEQGPYKQRSPMNKKIWKLAMKLEKKGIQVNMQYVLAHRNVRYNEVADQLVHLTKMLLLNNCPLNLTWEH